MKRNLYVLLSLVMVLSMLLGACSTTTPAVTQPAEQPPAGGQATQAPAVEEPTNAAEPTAEPTEAVEVPEPTEAPKTDRKGAWLDRIVFSAIPDLDSGVAQLEAGTIDMYADSSDDAAVFDAVKANPNLKYAPVYGASNQLIFNTVACSDSTMLNPFATNAIREAMNWAVDRNYIAEEIMGGLARPKYLALTGAFPDYARYADLIALVETKYAYDMEKAKEVLNDEMTKLGAELGSDGKWSFNGKPVVIKALIRVEDNRKEIGNYFANQLEALGFTVERMEKNYVDAGPLWLEEDPANCNYSFYTAGWGAQVISTDEGNMFVQYNTGKIQSIPVFSAYDPSPELLDAADRLYTSKYGTMEERRELFKTAIEKAMEESWWGLWVTDNIAFTPYRDGVEGASDLAAGFQASSMYPYTLRFEGQEGGEMKIAQANMITDPWNPIGGSNATFDGMVMKSTMDWGVIPDPYTGLGLPKLVSNAELSVVEGLPVQNSSDWLDLEFVDAEIQVPEDAWVDWDAENQKFITAGELYPDGITSKTKSTVYYVPELWDTTWHDGSNMSIGDFVMNMILTFDPGKKESKIFDEDLGASVETYLTHFKGVRIVSTDPLVIETYEDQYFLDAEVSITTWYPSQYVTTTSTNGMISWHAITPAILAEANGEMAFSNTKATTKKTEWTSLLAGPTLEIQAEYLDQAKEENYIPYEATLGTFITADEATSRWENLKKWYDTKKHLWLGTGPYFVDQVFPVEQTITVSRYEGYLFPADLFSGFGEPHIATALVEGPTSVQAGTEAVFDVLVNFGDEAYPNEDIRSVAYLVFNADNEVIAQGEAESIGEGAFEIVLDAEITSKMEAGGAKVQVAVASKVVSIPAFASLEFVVTK
jgi:peptide/nickel transport system substrate-binding protein